LESEGILVIVDCHILYLELHLMIKGTCIKGGTYTFLTQAETGSRPTFVFSAYVGSSSHKQTSHLRPKRKIHPVL